MIITNFIFFSRDFTPPNTKILEDQEIYFFKNKDKEIDDEINYD